MPTSRVNTSNGWAHHGLRSTSGARAPRGGRGNVASARASQPSSARTTFSRSAVHPVMRANTSPWSIAPPCSKHQVARAMSPSARASACRSETAASSARNWAISFCFSENLSATSDRLAVALGCSQSGKRARRPLTSATARPMASMSSGAPIASRSRSLAQGGEARDRVLRQLDLDAQRQREQGGGDAVVGARQRGEVDVALGHFAQRGGGQFEFGRLGFGALEARDDRVGVGRPRACGAQAVAQRIRRRAALGGERGRGARPVGPVLARQRVEVLQEVLRHAGAGRFGLVPLDFDAAGGREGFECNERVVASDHDLEPRARLRADHPLPPTGRARSMNSPRRRSRSTANNARYANSAAGSASVPADGRREPGAQRLPCSDGLVDGKRRKAQQVRPDVLDDAVEAGALFVIERRPEPTPLRLPRGQQAVQRPAGAQPAQGACDRLDRAACFRAPLRGGHQRTERTLGQRGTTLRGRRERIGRKRGVGRGPARRRLRRRADAAAREGRRGAVCTAATRRHGEGDQPADFDDAGAKLLAERQFDGVGVAGGRNAADGGRRARSAHGLQQRRDAAGRAQLGPQPVVGSLGQSCGDACVRVVERQAADHSLLPVSSALRRSSARATRAGSSGSGGAGCCKAARCSLSRATSDRSAASVH